MRHRLWERFRTGGRHLSVERAASRRGAFATVSALAALLCAFSPFAAAQLPPVIPPNTVVVSDDNAAADAATVREGVEMALEEAYQTGERVAVWVEQGEYTETAPIRIPGDANIHVIGLTPDDQEDERAVGRPWMVTVDGGGVDDSSGVFEIHTERAPDGASDPWMYYRYTPGAEDSAATFEERLSNVLIEGLTIRNGPYRVRIQGSEEGEPAIRPTLSRCIILGASQALMLPGGASAGVLVEGNAAPLLVNCVIGGYSNALPEDFGLGEDDETPPWMERWLDKQYSSKAGVWVQTPADPDAGLFTDILFCTVLLNQDYGVYVETGANARVRNTIVYGNGDGRDPAEPADDDAPPFAEEGGLVWADEEIVLEPDNGIYNVPTVVRIHGNNLATNDAAVGAVRVFFGPTSRAETAATVNAANSTVDMIEVTAPASYLAKPGPVNVHLIRDDGLAFMVPLGFTYTGSASTVPQVAAAIPETGPVWTDTDVIDPEQRGGNWTTIIGSGFERDARVYFDFNGDEAPDPDEESGRVLWLSSSKLYVQAPVRTTPTDKIDVLVVNPGPPSATSPAGPLKEYQYVDPTEGPRLDVVEISPNYYRDLGGTPGDADPEADPADRAFTADIVGWNIGPGAFDGGEPHPVIVKIGGIVCPYAELRQGPDNPAGDSYDEIRDVVIPVAEFGAAGAYDVEVINYDGERDVLANGFTYYADSAPGLDGGRLVGAGGELLDVAAVWRPSNFVTIGTTVYPVAPDPQPRTLLGAGFDTGLAITFRQPASGGEKIVDAAGDGIVMPTEVVEEHRGHTQRGIDLDVPLLPGDYGPGFSNVFGTEPRILEVEVRNALDVEGNPTDAAGDVKTVSAAMIYAANRPANQTIQSGESLYFEILQVDSIAGVHRDATVPGGTPAAYQDFEYRMRVRNWLGTTDMRLFVGGHEVDPEEITQVGPAPWIGESDVYFNVSQALPSGKFGTLDVLLLLPEESTYNQSGEPAYWVSEGAIWVPRTDADDVLAPPRLWSVSPRLIPLNGGIDVTLLGSDFIPPGSSLVRVPEPLDNASFEDGPATTTELPPGSTALPGWDIGLDGIQYVVADDAPAYDGDRFVHLIPRYDDVGSVEQSVATTPGGRYELVFAHGVHPELNVTDARFGRVIAYASAGGGQTVEFARPSGRTLPNNMRWTIRSMAFTATDPNTTIRLAHPDEYYPSNFGTVVDAVQLYQLLEDGTRVRVWAQDDTGTETAVPLLSGTHVADYAVSPPSRIDFVVQDLEPDPVLGLAANHNVPLDVEVFHDDGSHQPALDEDGNPLAHRLEGAIVLVPSYVAPEVTDLFRADLAAAGVPDARYGVVDGGDLVQLDGAGFNRGGVLPAVRFGDVEGRVLEIGETYTARDGLDYIAPDVPVGDSEPGSLLVVTPPALGGLAGRVPVTLVVDDAAFPDHVLEIHLPDELAYTYVSDGPPVITEVRPNFVSREASDAGAADPAAGEAPSAADSVYFTVFGRNFDDRVQLRFYVDANDDGIPDARGEPGPEDDVYVREHFAVSPSEIVVLAPSATDDLGLEQADFDDGIGTGSAGIVGLRIEVRNQPPSADPLADEDRVTSDPADLYYVDDTETPGLRTPVLAFNNAYLNYRDYVNVKPGMASLAAEPWFDPGPTLVSTPGPQMVRAEAEDWWLGKLALREDTYHNPMRDRAGNFTELPYTYEDLELDGRPDVPSTDIHGVGPTEDPVEGDESRRARLPDIGADEVSDPDSDADLAWYYAEISPNPVGRITTEGGLYVDVRVRGLRNLGAATRLDGGVDNDIFPPPAHRMFILPQGALQAAFDAGGRVNPEMDPDWVSEWLIPRAIPISYVNIGGGRYIGTNAEPIDTIVWENVAAKSPLDQGTPMQGDVLADGHAALFIYVPEELKRGDHELLGFTQNYHSQFPSPMSDASDTMQIVDQAVWGRHFIIDTVPPRLHVEWYGPGGVGFPDGPVYPWRDASTELEQDVFPLSGHNDRTTSENSSSIPGWLLPPVTLGGGAIYSPADPATVAPIEYSGAVYDLRRRAGDLVKPEQDAQIFFNVGSKSNGLPRENLDATIRVRLIDPHLTEAPASPYFDLDSGLLAGRTAQMGPPYNFDPYTGVTTRVVAGFDGPLYNFDTGDEGTAPIDELSHMFADAEAMWVIEQGDGFLDPPGGSGVVAPEVTGEFATDSQDAEALLPPLAALPPALEDDTLEEMNLDDVRANRGFAQLAPLDAMDYANNTLSAEWLLEGLDWNGADLGMGGQSFFQMAIRFMGRDRAGNRPPLGDLPEAMNMWWLLEAETIITTGPDPLEGTTLPAFAWNLNRDYDPDTYDGPRPIFRWGVYVTDPGDAMNGIYRSIGWSNWSTNTTLDAAEFAGFLDARGLDTFGSEFWVIVVLLGADEAGNVERWYETVPAEYNGQPQANVGADLFDPLPASDDIHVIDLRDTVPGGALREEWVEKLPNMWRFLWSGIPRPDTVVKPTFYHGDEATPFDVDLGSNVHVEMPIEPDRYVHARFQITATAEHGPGEVLLVAWDLLREGQSLVGGVIDPNDALENPIEMWPDPATIALQYKLGDEPARRKPVSYVFRAATFVDGSGDTLPNGVYDPGERIDPTWANLSFIVRPRASDQRVDPDVQVIKETEEQ